MKEIGNQTELLLRIKKGDKQAFDAVYYHYFNSIYRNALKLLRDEAAAEDVVQEVFIKLWEKRKLIRADISIGGWLFVLSYNMSVNKLRKKLIEAGAQKKLDAVPAADDISEIDFARQCTALELAIAQLSPQKRKVFEFCKLQGKTYEETAAELNISKYTVKEYLSSSVAFLKEYIKAHPELLHAAIFTFLVRH